MLHHLNSRRIIWPRKTIFKHHVTFSIYKKDKQDNIAMELNHDSGLCALSHEPFFWIKIINKSINDAAPITEFLWFVLVRVTIKKNNNNLTL